MRKGKLVAPLSVFVLLALILPGFSSPLLVHGSGENSDPLPIRSADCIFIEHNMDFDRLASENGWPGNGSQSNPYIISNQTIDCKGPSYGILISYTTYDFIIRNCTISNASGSNGGGIILRSLKKGVIEDCNITSCPNGILIINSEFEITNCNLSNNLIGIKLERCKGGYLEGNHCFNNERGVYITQSSERIDVWSNLIEGSELSGLETGNGCEPLSICNNTFSRNDFGVFVVDAPWTRVLDNHFTYQDDHHVRVQGCHNVTISGNDMHDWGDGISLGPDSRDIRILNNTLVDNAEYGMYVEVGSFGNEFYNNRMLGCSFYLEPDIEVIRGQTISQNNTVNGKQVYHYHDVDDIILNSTHNAGQVILGAVRGANIYQCEFTNGTIGVEIVECKSIRILKCELSGNTYYGLYGVGNNVVIVEYCTISNNLEGIFLNENYGSMIYGNEVTGNLVGVHIEGYDLYNGIMENIFEENSRGLELVEIGEFQSEYRDNISYNKFLENSDLGLFIDVISVDVYHNEFVGGALGIHSEDSVNDTVDFNTFNWCETGIKSNSKGSVYKFNTFSNGELGISIEGSGSDECWVYENVMIGMSNFGIFVQSNKEIYISRNRVESTSNGIELFQSNSHGIELYQSESVELIGNDLINCSIHISGSILEHFSKNMIWLSNNVNSKPVQYIYQNDPTTTVNHTDPGQIIIVDSAGLEFSDLSFSRSSIPLQVAYCEDIVFENISVEKQYIGAEILESSNIRINGSSIADMVRILNSEDVTISECEFHSSADNGIDIRNSNFINIQDCHFDESIKSIGIQVSDGCRIERNFFKECGKGIVLIASVTNTNIEKNFFYRSLGYAIDISKNCQMNSVINNAFKENNGSWHLSEPTDNYQIRCEDQQNIIDRNWWGAYTLLEDIGDGYLDEPIKIEGGPGLEDENPLTNIPGGIIPAPIHTEGIVKWNETTLTMTWDFMEMPAGMRIDLHFFYWFVDGEVLRKVNQSYHSDDDITMSFNPYDIDKQNTFSIQARTLGGLTYPFNYYWDPPREEPVIEFIEPIDGQMFNHSDIWIKWRVTSDVADIFSNLISYDGLFWQRLERGTYEEFDASNSDGWHNYWVKVYDKYGNIAVKNVSYFVDRRPPDIWITSPEEGLIEGGRIPLTWDVYDELSDIRSVWMKINGEFYKDLTINQRREVLEIYEDGEYVIDICVWDMLYNFNSARLRITVDSKIPIIGHSIHFDYYGKNDHAIFFSFSEEMDRSTWSFWLNDLPYEYSWSDTGDLTINISQDLGYNQTYQLTLYISDLAGNFINYTYGFRTPRGPYNIKEVGNITFILIGPDIEDGWNVKIYIDGDIKTTENLPATITIQNIGYGNHTLMIVARGAKVYQSEFELGPSGDLDLGTITLERGEKDEETNTNYALMVALFILAVVLVAAFIAVILFVRSKDDHYEE